MQTNHCHCCNCVRLAQYEQLKSKDEQISYLLSLSTVDRLRLVVADTTFTYVDELLVEHKAIDMKQLFFHIKARFSMQDCADLHTFTDISDKQISELVALFAAYVIFQIDILDDYFDLHFENQQESLEHENQNALNFETLKYMFSDECEFILSHILQTQEQKENYVNTLMRRYYIYYDYFKQYVTNETIRHFIDFHN